jgi:hypothetical protein
MKRVFEAVLLAAALAGCAPAGIVDFSTLVGPVPIMTPGLTSVGDVQFQYDPQSAIGNPAVPCLFNGGAGGGTQFDFTCVGAHVDAGGILGTSDGVYLLDFAVPVTWLSLNYGIFSTLNPVPDPPGYTINALFFNSGNLTAVDTLPGASGTYLYAGSVFTHLELSFEPNTQSLTDPNTGLTLPVYGRTLVQVSQIAYNPEPGTAIFLALGLLGIGVARRKRRK